MVGFQCECGYKHVQLRPVVSSEPAADIALNSGPHAVLREMGSKNESG
jgi:hypothetical protein